MKSCTTKRAKSTYLHNSDKFEHDIWNVCGMGEDQIFSRLFQRISDAQILIIHHNDLARFSRPNPRRNHITPSEISLSRQRDNFTI